MVKGGGDLGKKWPRLIGLDPLGSIRLPSMGLKCLSSSNKSCRSFGTMQFSHQIRLIQSSDEEDMTPASLASPMALRFNISGCVFQYPKSGPKSNLYKNSPFMTYFL